MKAEDYFLTLKEDIKYEFTNEGVCLPVSSRCNCFCCDKFGYHSVTVTHKPTGIKNYVRNKVVKPAVNCHKECAIAFTVIKDPVDLAIEGLKIKIKDFCNSQKVKEAQIEMIKEAEKEMMRVKKKNEIADQLTCEQKVFPDYKESLTIETIEKINELKRMVSDLDKFIHKTNFQGIEQASEKLEEFFMLATNAFIRYYTKN